jgi:hypothetical protein
MLAPDTAAMTPTMRGQFPSTSAQAPRPSRRERMTARLAGAALVVPPWLAGTGDLWAQWIAFALAALAFGMLFAPMFDYRSWPPSATARTGWGKLARFPVFWLGLVILIYGGLAASNPWLALTGEGTQAWFEALRFSHWLPRSLETPFWDMNAWHVLLIIAPAWLVACAVWAGVGTAGSLLRLLGAVAVNGGLLALLGLLQYGSGAREMFWFYDPRPWFTEPTFFSTFIYPGHAGAWLLLALGAVFGCMMHSAIHKSWWTGFWLVLMLILLLPALGLSSFTIYFWLAPGVAVLANCAVQYKNLMRRRRVAWVFLGVLPAVLMTVFVVQMAVSTWALGGEQVDPRAPSLAVRYQLARTSATMIKDEAFWGWGPGSYRYIAPFYLKRNPLFTEPGDPGVLRYRVDYAHSDWVQFPIEWGLAGTGLFVAVLAWWTARVWKLRRALPLESWSVLGAVVLVLVGAGLDFPLNNQAVLIALAGLLAVAVKLGETTGELRMTPA